MFALRITLNGGKKEREKKICIYKIEREKAETLACKYMYICIWVVGKGGKGY